MMEDYTSHYLHEYSSVTPQILKKIAEMREDIWIDDILNKEIDKPSEEISLPIVYYGILLLIDIITRILI